MTVALVKDSPAIYDRFINPTTAAQGVSLISQTSDLDAILKRVSECNPKIILLDADLSNTRGLTRNIELIRQISQQHPRIVIVLVASGTNRSEVNPR
jgi:DNA-binding NarL/FixJ family response regulator